MKPFTPQQLTARINLLFERQQLMACTSAILHVLAAMVSQFRGQPILAKLVHEALRPIVDQLHQYSQEASATPSIETPAETTEVKEG